MNHTNQSTKWLAVLVAVLFVATVGYFAYRESGINAPSASVEPVKIGIITPLTGAVAYWGESSVLGIELAKRELQREGIVVEFIVEDGQLDPKVALNAAQKLVNVDRVDAIYSEFSPAAIAVASFVKDKDILYLYNAAPVSPLAESPNIFKTYLDFKNSCKKAAKLFKGRGIERVGVLKVILEFGDLCAEGITDVFGDGAFVESYNSGETNFRAALSVLALHDPQVLFNFAFQPEVLVSLRQIKELGVHATFVSVSENISPDILEEYGPLLEGAVFVGLPAVSQDFISAVDAASPDTAVGNYHAAALAYIHMKQIAHALQECSKALDCVREELSKSRPEPLIGFTGFTDRIAGFEVLIEEWRDGKLVDVLE